MTNLSGLLKVAVWLLDAENKLHFYQDIVEMNVDQPANVLGIWQDFETSASTYVLHEGQEYRLLIEVKFTISTLAMEQWRLHSPIWNAALQTA